MTVSTTPPAALPPDRLPLDDPRRRGSAGRTTPQPFAPVAPPDPPVPARSVAELPEIDAEEDFFPDPDATKRLEGEAHGLPAGHWIEVRRMLTFGQELHLQAAALPRSIRQGQTEFAVDYEQVTIQKLLAWVVAWSFTHKGQPAPLDEQHLRGMHPLVAAAVSAAVDAHIEAIQQGNPRATNGTTRP